MGKVFFTSWAVVVFALVVGWFMNLVQVIHMASADITVLLALKIVGIFIPFLGGVLGYV